MADKCFCHLNGYKVKDADARKAIEEIKETLNTLDTETIELIENEVKSLKDKDVIMDVVSRETNFNTDAMFYNYSHNLEMFVVENYDDSRSIDNTKDDGEYVLTNNYDSEKHCITVSSGSIKMFRSTVVPFDKEYGRFFIHIDKDGEGSIEAYVSSDGGTTFNPIVQDEIVECLTGKNFTVQLKLTGNVVLHNLCWGVRTV